MTNDKTDTDTPRTLPPAGPLPARRRFARTLLAAVAICGAVVGAGAMRVADRATPRAVMLLQPTSVTTMRDGSMVAVKGRVAETFGNTFTLDDGTARTLVDTGRVGEGRTLAKPDETVTVQGRFDKGKLHAVLLVHADGHADTLDAPPPPPPPPGSPPGGPGARRAGLDAPQGADAGGGPRQP